MKDSQNIIVYETTILRKALSVIDNGTMRIAVVVNKDNKVLGTLNDGDTRRAILNGYSLDDSIKDIYYKSPSICNFKDSKEKIIKTAILNKVYQIPIVDDEYKLVDIEDLATLLTSVNRKNKVILMAGGLGTRLQPLTKDTPKPLLKVGNKPILQTIIESFASYGFIEIIISVNYKSNMIKNYFQDGNNFGVNISYIEEDKRLGTAGALSLIKDEIKEPFFVMNADLLTNVNFEHLLDFHVRGNAVSTMCVREYDFQVPYGVIEIDNDKVSSIVEKPVHKFFVNAGIYLLSPDVLSFIPKDTFYDMPTLFDKLIKQKKTVLSFPIHEYWLDIGKMEDFKKAQIEFKDISKE